MKKKWVFGGILFFVLITALNITIYDVLSNNISQVHAQPGVKYSYDSLGRVDTATYSDGTEVKYIYDRNGNMLSTTIQKTPQGETGGTGSGTETPGQGETGGTGSGSETPGQGGAGGTGSGTGTPGQGGAGGTGSGTGTPGQGETGGSGTGGTSSDVQQPVVSVPHDTAEDIRIYNAFKKRKPVIKSLKVKTEKSKRYLKIQIRKVGKNSLEMEHGYQIQYATNSKFKKAKKVDVEKKKGKSMTGTKWKVKKNKTYYVRVRAYKKTKTGKTIYTKYSKTKKISV